jgi:hypothetical protein
MSEEAAEKLNLQITPPLTIPRLQFLYAQPQHQERAETKEKLIGLLQQHSMFYSFVLRLHANSVRHGD